MSNSSNNTASPTVASTWIKRIVVGVIVLVALVYGAIFFYANVLNDSPDALNTDDLAEALEPTAPDTAGADTTGADTTGADTTGAETTGDSTAATDPAAGDPAQSTDGFDGVWVPTAASEFGYRVDEILGGVNVTAVGRSNEIAGSLTVDGTTASIEATVEVANITSDDERRDGQFRGRIMDVETFPTATFRTTEPIDFNAIPAEGQQVTATAVGELTLKAVTLPVTFEVTAQTSGGNIGVLGSIPITFTDYGIDNPSNPGVSLEDNGIVEFILVFERG